MGPTLRQHSTSLFVEVDLARRGDYLRQGETALRIARWTMAAGGLLLATVMLAAQTGAGTRVFSLHDRLVIELSATWSERRDILPPPQPVLAASAPPLRFSDFMVLEDRHTPALLQFGFSDNPFEGLDPGRLETRLYVQRGALAHLFYFFFPPPAECLARGQSAFERAKIGEIERRDREARSSKEDDRPRSLSPISVSSLARCEFAPTPRDLFASRLSPSVRFRLSSSRESVTGELRDFYLPAMTQMEIGEMTFFIFEAQDNRLLEFADVERFGLRPEMNGARVHYFWAVGARTPFPFLREFDRRDRQLVHVAAATLSLRGEARDEFLDLLRRIRFH